MSIVRSIRMSEDLDETVRDLAHVETVTVNALIVAAIEAYVDNRRAQPGFGDLLRARIERDRQALARIAGAPGGGSRGNA